MAAPGLPPPCAASALCLRLSGLSGAPQRPAHPDELVRHDCEHFRFQRTGQAVRRPSRIEGRLAEIKPDAGIVRDFLANARLGL